MKKCIFFPVFFLFFISFDATSISEKSNSYTLIENVHIFDGKTPSLSKKSNVLIYGNKIINISDKAASFLEYKNLTRIDGKGHTLMPGLIDNHVHLILGANYREDIMNSNISLNTLQERATEEARAMLMRGFTSVRDMGGPMLTSKVEIDEGDLAGPRIYPSGGMISQTSGHGDFRLPSERARRFGGEISRGELLGIGFIADGRDDVLVATRENLRAGATQIKLMAGGGAATPYDPLDVVQYTIDEMKSAVEAASDWGTYVTVHAYNVKSVRRAINAGVQCIEHGQLLDEDTIKLMSQKGIWLSLQALDEAPVNAPKSVIDKKNTVIKGTDNTMRLALKYNVKLAWGTDYLFSPDNNKNQNRDIIKLKKWMSSYEILKLITHDNAQLLSLSGLRDPYPGKKGVIEIAALADLIIVNGNPLENIELISNPDKNISLIMKDGKIYKNNI